MILNENDVLFAKTRPNAKLPTKRNEDGWYDLYFTPHEGWDNENFSFIIKPFTTHLIPTGIASAFSPLYRAKVTERGSTGSIGLKVSAGCIDSGFRGEWFVALYNANNIPIEITSKVDKTTRTDKLIQYPFSKAIAQFGFEEVPNMSISETDWETLYTVNSERGDGMLGSSGK